MDFEVKCYTLQKEKTQYDINISRKKQTNKKLIIISKW